MQYFLENNPFEVITMSGVKDAAPLTLVLENKLLAILRDHNVNSIVPFSFSSCSQAFPSLNSIRPASKIITVLQNVAIKIQY